MKKTIYSRFDKKEITDLPVVTFPGRIITIITAGEAEKAVDYLLDSDIMGVDTETKPTFHKGEQHKVALLQVSNRDTCFLFRLNLTDITPAIKRLLEDTRVKRLACLGMMTFVVWNSGSCLSPGCFTICRIWSENWALRTLVCRRYMPISSTKRYPSVSVCPTGRLQRSLISRSNMLPLMHGAAYDYTTRS